MRQFNPFGTLPALCPLNKIADRTKLSAFVKETTTYKMRINPIQTTPINKQEARAFTLIEMIGVLAVIAILAALLIPKVFSAINDARINNACISIDTIKTAVADHYGKYGKLATVFGTNDMS